MHYGAAQEDLNKVGRFALDQGLTVVEASIARRTVIVAGTAAHMSRAFMVELGRYESPTESYRGREGPIYLPNDVAEIVMGVFGLDNRQMARPSAPPGAAVLTPPQVAGLYNFPKVNAEGQTIGILAFGGGGSAPTCGFSINDIQKFMESLGLPFEASAITSVPVDGNAPSGSATNPSDQDIEVTGDISVAISVAQGVKVVVYFTPNSDQGLIDGVNTAIHDATNQPSVLSISIAKSELLVTQQGKDTLTLVFQEAAALGVTVLVASGDTGTNDRVHTTASVFWPASDPWVTACGGTILTNVVGPSFNEGTWQDENGATGGGVSDLFPLPDWQAGANIPPSVNPGNRRGRGVPDVAGNASPFSGYSIIVYGTRRFSFAGTSSVAPLYAALVAMINKVAREPIGYLNPRLYALATSPGQTVFRDVADDKTNAFSTTFPTIGYPSGPGWDACTGWGRIDGSALLDALVTNPDDPFKFGIRPGETSWLNVHDVGNTSTGGDVQLGDGNSADPNDATVITTQAAKNAAFAAQNTDPGDGAVGVFGRSKGTTRSIGVAGLSETGCGVYGISTSGKTIGVAGRSMGGAAVEDMPLEEVVGAPVGVLGHATHGAGVRGHSGPLLVIAHQTPAPPPLFAPGGVFSSGQLSQEKFNDARDAQPVSLEPRAQLRLIPSTVNHLPLDGQIGDFFITFMDGLTGVPRGGMQLWICVDVQGTMPFWAKFQLEAQPVQGGTKIG